MILISTGECSFIRPSDLHGRGMHLGKQAAVGGGSGSIEACTTLDKWV